MATPSPSKNLPSSSSKLRKSESMDPMRRSFIGSPFPTPFITPSQRDGGFRPNPPANSPSDLTLRRHSTGKENLGMASRDNHDRENGTDESKKSGKFQSPSASKGSKHFMSPTISAASKVNPSPRRKVLTERDEQSRTPISCDGGKLPSTDGLNVKAEKCSNKRKEVSFDSAVIYLGEEHDAFHSEDDLDSKVGSFVGSESDVCSLLEAEIVDNDLVNLDPSFKISPRQGCPSPLPAAASLALSDDAVPPLSPLDADPHAASYDPKTNYLSPRPRFLHYKHNPRVELYFKKEMSGDLKKSFSDASLSDTEDEEVSSDVSQAESEDVSSNVASGGSAKNEEEDELVVVSEPVSASECEAPSVDSEVKKRHARHFLTRTKFLAILMILASVGFYVSLYSSPLKDSSVLNNLNFPELYVPSQLSSFARDRLEQGTQRFQSFLHECLSYLHNLVLGFSRRHKLVVLEYANLTSLLEDDTLVVDKENLFTTAFQKEAKINNFESWPVTEGGISVLSIMERNQHTEATEEAVQGDDYDQESEDQEENELLLLDEENDRLVYHTPEAAEEESTSVDHIPEAAKEETSVDHTPEAAQEESTMAFIVDNPDLVAALDVAEVRQEYHEAEELERPALEVDSTPTDSSNLIENHEAEELERPALEVDSTPTDSSNLIENHEPEELERPAHKVDSTPTDATVVPVLDQPNSVEPEHTMMAGFTVLALVITLLAALALLHRKLPRAALPSNDDASLSASPMPTQIVEKNHHQDPIPAPLSQQEEDSHHVLSTNWVTEVEEHTDDEDTCASSAMSGSRSAASNYRKEPNGAGTASKEEATSPERSRAGQQQRSNNRRESSASSYSGGGAHSQSYGSFTTYEKLPTKQKGRREEEAVSVAAVTPVRRSSRLNKTKMSSSPVTSDIN